MALTHTPAAELGTLLPQFRLPTTKPEQLVDSTQFTQGPLLIVFMCNHCPYVLAIEDRLIALGHDLKKLDIPMIGISSNDASRYPADSFAAMQARAEEKQYSFTYAYDETQEVARNFGAVCTPDFFLFDQGLHLAYRGRLDDSWKDPGQVTRRELFIAAQDLKQGKSLIGLQQHPSMGCSIKWKEHD